MIARNRQYNTGKAVTRDELNNLIQDAKANGDWSRVEQANVSKITDMFNLFYGANGIKDLNLDGWDTSSVMTMNGIFLLSDYNHPLNFDTANVTNMSYMFYGSKYNHPLYFDTSNVTDMRYMFYDSKYNHPLHLDTSNVIDMYEMFSNSDYNHPLNFDISNVIDIRNIFDNASTTHPIVFKGGNIPDDVQDFIDENNNVYDEKCKLDSVVHNEFDVNHNSKSVVSSLKL